MPAAMRPQRQGEGGAPACPSTLWLVALLALAATVTGQPGYDGYGPVSANPSDNLDGGGMYPATPATKPTRSKICPETIWGKDGKCNQEKFEACARKVVRAYNDGFVTKGNVSFIMDRFSSFLLPSGIGRITPMGIMPGGRIPEYLAIWSYVGGPGAFFSANQYTVRRFIARCPIVVATVDAQFTSVVTGKTGNLTYEQWFRIDKATNRIATSDLDMMRFQEFGTALGLPTAFQANEAFYASLLGDTICNAHTKYCTGTLQQYSSKEDCKSFLAAITTFDYTTQGGNNTYCRYLHSAFMQVEPFYHCGHIGKNSGTCRDVTYDSYYKDTRFNAPTFVMGGTF